MGAEKLLVSIESSRPHYKRPEQVGTPGSDGLVKAKAWDFVIIGGGSSGLVLASRLSERSDFSVLVLEAGGSGSALLLSRIPATYPLLFRTKHDWNLYTVPQKHSSDRKWFWPRGKMLGGCSSINAMMYHYGAPEDFAEWSGGHSEAPGASQWTYENMKPYYHRFESFVPHKDFPKTDMTQRNQAGKIETGFGGNFGAWAQAFVHSCEEVGIPASADLNTLHGSLGVTKIMTYISKKGTRSTSETGYLTPEVLKRPNLTVVTHAHVTKLIFDREGGEQRVVGVEFSDRKKSGDKRYFVRVNKEAILSAGAVHSPQILMLSGIGLAEHLKSHDIPVVVDLPGVGQNLKDHPVVDTMWRVKCKSLSWLRPNTGFVNDIKSGNALFRWLFTHKGPLATNLSEAAAFLRTDDPRVFPPPEFPRKLEDSTSGPGAPDLELISLPVSSKGHGSVEVPKGELASICAVLLRPTSSGTITLSSNNPFDAPVIDPHYFETQHDVDVLVRGIRLAFKLAKAGPLAAQIDVTEKDPAFDTNLDRSTDEELAKIVRDRAQTLYHPTSTVRMAPLAQGGCVDYHLRLHGVPNLRVVDDSILPNIVSGHTAGPAFALGEKASDLIKEAYAPPKSA